jgi:hypothetical protein
MRLQLKFVQITTVLLVFAGGSAGLVYAAPPSDACSLLTADEASSVLGAMVGAGQHIVQKICQWSAPRQAGGPAKRAMITLQNPDAFARAKMPIGQGIIKSDVSGVGEDAVYVTAPGAPTTLSVKKGDAAFMVQVFGFPDDQIKAKEKTLALDVLAKL